MRKVTLVWSALRVILISLKSCNNLIVSFHQKTCSDDLIFFLKLWYFTIYLTNHVQIYRQKDFWLILPQVHSKFNLFWNIYETSYKWHVKMVEKENWRCYLFLPLRQNKKRNPPNSNCIGSENGTKLLKNYLTIINIYLSNKK